MAGAAGLLFAVSPFAVLQPLGYLVRTGEYSLRYDWIYLGLALAIACSPSAPAQGFYYAGLLNTGGALFLIADHRHWFDRPLWALAVIVSGLAFSGRDSCSLVWSVGPGDSGLNRTPAT